MKYLKLVQTDAELNDPQLDSPSVYLSEESLNLAYFHAKQKPTPTYEMVDLGLSVKWATCNLGASSPEEYGNYYAWGETTGYDSSFSEKQFNWDDYTMTSTTITGLYRDTSKDEDEYYAFTNGIDLYFFDDDEDPTNGGWVYEKNGEDFVVVGGKIYGEVGNYSFNKLINISPLTTKYDAVAALGGNYRMPTQAEYEELFSLNMSIETINTIKGVKFTSENGNSIFIPCAGGCTDGKIMNTGTTIGIWTTSIDEDKENKAYKASISLTKMEEITKQISNTLRCYGYSIRPVCE